MQSSAVSAFAQNFTCTICALIVQVPRRFDSITSCLPTNREQAALGS